MYLNCKMILVSLLLRSRLHRFVVWELATSNYLSKNCYNGTHYVLILKLNKK